MNNASRRLEWVPVFPVPETAPAARLKHSQRGEPLRCFIYRSEKDELLGLVARFLSSTGDPVHLTMLWCQADDGTYAWRWKQFPKMRPLFGRESITQSTDDSLGLVLTFDELSAVCARDYFPGLGAVSWPGGIRKIDEVDWSPLRGMKVFIWPTLTRDRAKLRRDIPGEGPLLPRDQQSGWKAAAKLEKILRGYGCDILGIVDPWLDPALPEGFCVAMMQMQDHTGDQAITWMLQHIGTGPEMAAARQRLMRIKGESVEDVVVVDAAPADLHNEPWQFRLLRKNGEVSPCLANVYDILSNAKEWRGVVAFDEFAQRVVKRAVPPYEKGAVGEWDQTDDSRTAMWLSRAFNFTPSSLLIAEAVEVLARSFSFHPVRDWLRGQKWDGVPRLEDWLSDFLGVEKSEYSARVGPMWLMGAVARVMRPGVKFDYCLVLEGEQGKGKSSAFAILGGEWFGDTDIDLSNKDSMSAMRGKLIYEFSEMGALTKAEETRQKSFLSRQVDEYRPVYGRREIRVPRQVVFGASTNLWEWNKDPTGGRRFWPVDCNGEFNLDGLREQREQLFAEAFVRYQAGEKFYPTPEEQRRLFDPEQLRRELQDSLVDALHDWVYSRTGDFSIAQATLDGLELDASKLTRDLQTRVGIALKKLGCTRVEKRNGMIRYWYKPPARSGQGVNRIDEEDEHAFATG